MFYIISKTDYKMTALQQTATEAMSALYKFNQENKLITKRQWKHCTAGNCINTVNSVSEIGRR